MKLARVIATFFLFVAPVMAESPSQLTLVVHHLFDGKPIEFAKPGLTTASKESISVTRLAYLLSEPSLKPIGDDNWLGSRDWFAFTDAEKGDGIHTLNGLPRRKFEMLRFHVGPDALTDHADPSVYPPRHALNPNVNGLHWGWAAGFVYLAIEGNLATKSKPSGYSYHIAGTPNRMEITVPVDVDLAHDTTLELDFNIEKIFAGKSPVRLSETNSTHSRTGDDTATQIKTQIEHAFALHSIHATAATPLPANTGSTAPLIGTPYRFTIPKGIPLPELPTDFPLTNERVALGKRLFHDKRLSHNDSQSCSSCHDAAFGFADHLKFSLGADGDMSERNAMPLCNLAWKKSFFWDGRAPSLRVQALEPIQNPIEMHESLDRLVEKLNNDPGYRTDFEKTFGSKEITAQKAGIALEAFVLTLTSFNSKFDRAMRKEVELTDQEKRGFELFITEYDPRQNQFGADCFHCHGGALFTDNQFHNNGLPADRSDPGRARVTKRAADNAKFSTPSLRNVALTAPYMHDGRFQTLEEVVDHYDHGVVPGETLDPNLAKHPRSGLGLTAADKKALVAFLKTLTDERTAAAEK